MIFNQFIRLQHICAAGVMLAVCLFVAWFMLHGMLLMMFVAAVILLV
jgi:hypothetical protein